MGAAATDHVFLDGGHTVDFTNKAFEVLDHLGWEQADRVCRPWPTRRRTRPVPKRVGAWRHPHDLAGLLARAEAVRWAAGRGRAPDLRRGRRHRRPGLGVLGDDPAEIVLAIDRAFDGGATARSGSGRRLRRRASRHAVPHPERPWRLGCRPPRLHARPTPCISCCCARCAHPLRRGIYHGALKVFLDRFLNVPAAPLPGRAAASAGGRAERPARVLGSAGHGRRGRVDRYGWLAPEVGGRPSWLRSAPPCCTRTPSSTGSRCSRRPSASRQRGRRAPSRRPSYWPAPPGSWPPTPRLGASCPRSCASPAGCVGASPCTSNG